MATSAVPLTAYYGITWTYPGSTIQGLVQSSTLSNTPGTTSIQVSTVNTAALESFQTQQFNILLSVSNGGVPPGDNGSVTTWLGPSSFKMPEDAIIPTTAAVTTTTSATSRDSATNKAPGATSRITSHASISSAGPVHTPSPPAPEGRIPAGKAAGIAVACAAAGAVIAILIAFCFRSWRRQASRSVQDSPTTISTGLKARFTSEKGGKHTPSAKPLAANTHLPPPMEESTIANNASRLNTMIKNHAQSFFTNTSQQAALALKDPTFGHLDRLLGTHSQIQAESLILLLSNPKYRVGAVRFLLAWTILKNVEYGASLDYTLLPPGLVQCLQSMKLSKEDSSEQLMELFSRWRYVSGALMRPTYGSKEIEASDSRQYNISKLTNLLDDALRPFATPRNGNERQRNMEEIIRLGARDGYVLFTQPTTWTFQWHGSGTSRSQLVVYPALVRIGDDEGRMQSRDRYQYYGDTQTINISAAFR